MKQINKKIFYSVVGLILIISIINITSSYISKSNSANKNSTNNNLNSSNNQHNKKSSHNNENKKTQLLTNDSPIKLKNPRSVSPKKNYLAPKWSPNGLDILYTGPKYKGLYIASADGTRVKKISGDIGIGYNARWSSDGTKIITYKNGETTVYDIAGDEVTDSSESFEDKPKVFARNNNIYYRNHDNKNEEKLGNGEDSFYGPKLSPNENKVLYSGMVTGIYIRDFNSGRIVKVGPGTNPQWSFNSQGVIYNFTQDDGKQIISSDLYFAYADGLNTYNITNTPDIIELNPQISPDGSQITYEVDGQIFVAELQGL